MIVRLSIVLILIASGREILAQGPVTGFMPGRKNTDIALAYSVDSYSTYLFGEERRDQSVTTRSAALFLERGFSDSFSLVLNVPYLWIDEENRGLQDGQVFIKYRNQYKEYPLGNLSLITAVGLSFPFSSYPKDTETPIGEGAAVFQGRFLIQYNFDSGLFFHLQSGFNFRFIPEAQSSWPVLFRTGFGAPRFYVEAWLELLRTFNAGIDTQILGGAGSNWVKAGGTIYIPIIQQLGVFVGGSRIFSGRNIGLSNRINAGLVVKM